MATTVYAPPTLENDPKRQNQALQDHASKISSNTDNITTNTTAISALQTAGATYVVGPGSSTNNGFVQFNGTTGKLVKDHAATIALGSEVSGTLPVANGGTNYTGGAWTTYTPTITASSGAFTSVSASGSFLTIGKLVHYTCTVTITTVGTAAGSIVLPLPTGTAVRNAVGMGTASNLGKSVGYRILASGSSGDIAFYDNTSAIAAGNVIIVTGIYELS